MSNEGHAGTRLLLGGRICLDFCNTIDAHDSDHPHEWLVSYLDLIRWSIHAETVEQQEGDRLLKQAEANPGEASDILTQALGLREAIYQIFTASIYHRPIPTVALAALNGALSVAASQQQIVCDSDGFTWGWQSADRLDRVLWSIARSAADVLTQDRLDRVRQCPGCGWLFLDQSKNRSRTWCDMRFCGNRAKSRRHYRRSAGSIRS